VLKYLGYFLALLILSLITLTFIPVDSVDPKAEMEIYLLSNEIHTDIAIPVRNKVFNWEEFLNPSDFESRPVGWIEIGWGDRQFYFEMPTWDKFTFRLALDALLKPDPAVMHVSYLDHHPAQYVDARKVTISFATYEKLVSAIKDYFKMRNKTSHSYNG
jgi:uncharacterized protein (TIGR02117 family)